MEQNIELMEKLWEAMTINHFLYSSGWATHNYTMGRPLVTSPIINKEVIGIFNDKVAHHLGISGWFHDNLHCRFSGTYSLNSGTNHSPFQLTKRAYSFLSEFHYQLSQGLSWRLKLKLAADFGNMYGKNVGMLLGVSYRGLMGE